MAEAGEAPARFRRAVPASRAREAPAAGRMSTACAGFAAVSNLPAWPGDGPVTALPQPRAGRQPSPKGGSPVAQGQREPASCRRLPWHVFPCRMLACRRPANRHGCRPMRKAGPACAARRPHPPGHPQLVSRVPPNLPAFGPRGKDVADPVCCVRSRFPHACRRG